MLNKYLQKIYKNYPRLRRVFNFLGLSLGSSTVLLATGGTCPFCGAPAVACPGGAASMIATGTLATIIIYLLLGTKRVLTKLLRRAT